MERKAQSEDRIVAALGTQVAVADVLAMMLGKKGTKPKGMQNFIAQMGGESGSSASAGDSKEMSQLRSRIGKLVNLGKEGK